jgi:S-DNA-T family DNA segregation ATPase FtsK/SpoIIIE
VLAKTSRTNANFNFELARLNCYVPPMAQKSGSDGKHGMNEVIGILLLAAALLLLVAQLSFDRYDLASVRVPPNREAQNWIGTGGAYFAYATFCPLGLGAYLVPWLLALMGVSYLLNLFAYLREHLRWTVGWMLLLLVSLTGLLHLASGFRWLHDLASNIYTPYAGGWLGYLTYGQTRDRNFGFSLLSPLGATVIYATLGIISLLFLTNFHLSEWIRMFFDKIPSSGSATADEDKLPDEINLEKRARDLEKQKRKLEQEVERAEKPENGNKSPKTNLGLGADGLPVPPPTVRDLSVPQADGPKIRKSTYPNAPKLVVPEPVPVVEEVIPAEEIRAATTDDILGKRPSDKNPGKTDEQSPETKAAEPAAAEANTDEADKPAAPKVEPVVIIADGSVTVPKPKAALRKKPITVASTPLIGNYQLPPMDFLQHPDMTAKPTESKEELMANARLMQQTLAQFGIEVSLGDITKGPTITRYELHPAPGVKLEKIQSLSNNLAAALKAERIHILVPVPGKSSVGVEVPNTIKTKVIMRDLFESDEWRNTKARIPIALGKDVYGHPIIADLAEMPHLLIAGSTGSGKSVCINSIIASLLYRFSPDQLRFVMIDPKVVEMQQYNALPHLVVPVVTDPKKVLLALRWVVNEMEKRYQIFARVGVRNIKSFNDRPKDKPLPPAELELPLAAKKEKVEPGADGFAVEVDEQIVVPREEDIIIPEKLSYVVVIIDELADLMLVAPADVEMAIARITQMARAAGIHCIVATQRPSVDVITGVIKANIPARIAFQVASRVDSRTILDAMGADKLLGKGDMLYLPPGSANLKRAQGALITDHELEQVVDFIAKQAKPSYEPEIHKQLSKPTPGADIESGIDEDEEIVQQCIEVIRSEQKASVSLLQRRLRLGYGRAARIMDELEQRGIVGPSNGAEPREILIDLDGQGADGGGQQAV